VEQPTSIAFLEPSVLFFSSMHVCVYIYMYVCMYVYTHTVVILVRQGGSSTERMAGSNLKGKVHNKIVIRSD